MSFPLLSSISQNKARQKHISAGTADSAQLFLLFLICGLRRLLSSGEGLHTVPHFLCVMKKSNFPLTKELPTGKPFGRSAERNLPVTIIDNKQAVKSKLPSIAAGTGEQCLPLRNLGGCWDKEKLHRRWHRHRQCCQSQIISAYCAAASMKGFIARFSR